ncbi:MAG: hypothetical protein GF387_01885 [Candidatus Portnoybacteria bacterium]|nr:hypothetical protein [Candidatus Portnoybacteria bacterium]
MKKIGFAVLILLVGLMACGLGEYPVEEQVADTKESLELQATFWPEVLEGKLLNLRFTGTSEFEIAILEHHSLRERITEVVIPAELTASLKRGDTVYYLRLETEMAMLTWVNVAISKKEANRIKEEFPPRF